MNERIITPPNVRGAMNRNKDLDPNKWRPKFYVANLECDTEVAQTASTSVVLDNIPFVLDYITHGITENTMDDTLAARFFQDGQYLIDWKDDHTAYQDAPIQADLMFGSVWSGFVIPLPVRIIYPGSKTLTVNMQNLVNRTADGNTFKIQVVFHGFERWRR